MWGGFHSQILKKPIRWETGYVMLPREPGLGIEIDEDVALAHPYTGTKLHLEMINYPVR
jgi:galactonate dehydratase